MAYVPVQGPSVALHRCYSKFSAAVAAWLLGLPRSFGRHLMRVSAQPGLYCTYRCTFRPSSAHLTPVPPHASLSASQQFFPCDYGSNRTIFCGLWVQESTRPKVTDSSSTVLGTNPAPWHGMASLLIVLHYHEDQGRFRETPDDIHTASWPDEEAKSREKPWTIRMYTTYLHPAGRASLHAERWRRSVTSCPAMMLLDSTLLHLALRVLWLCALAVIRAFEFQQAVSAV